MEDAPEEGLGDRKHDTSLSTQQQGRDKRVGHNDGTGQVSGAEQVKVLEHNKVAAEVIGVEVTARVLVELVADAASILIVRGHRGLGGLALGRRRRVVGLVDVLHFGS